jgi:hypothetical protein
MKYDVWANKREDFHMLHFGDDAPEEEAWYDLKAKFTRYWNNLKNYINELRNLGSVIDKQRERWNYIFAYANNDSDTKEAKAGLQRNAIQKSTWQSIKDKIETYLPEWLAADAKAQQDPASLSGLGFLPILIGVAALAALAYVATYGLQLLKDTKTEENVLKSLESRLISTHQAEVVLGVTKKQPTVSTPSLFNVSLGNDTSYLIIGVLAFGAYLYFRPKFGTRRA